MNGFEFWRGSRMPLDRVSGRQDNDTMTLSGRVHNGVVVFEGGATLPEGTPVSVAPRTAPVIRVSKRQRRVDVPIVHSSQPGSLDLTGDMIAAILNAEDLPS